MLFRTIVADPPWTPKLHANCPKADRKAHPKWKYNTLSLEEISKITIPAEKKAHLYLWTTNTHIDWGYVVARAWGFEPVTVLTWCKPGLGVGRFQCNTEHVILARKGGPVGNAFGKMGQTGSPTHGTYFHWPRGRHSEKPQDFFELVKTMSYGPFLEMFARSKREGWSVWGNEVECDVEITVG